MRAKKKKPKKKKKTFFRSFEEAFDTKHIYFLGF